MEVSSFQIYFQHLDVFTLAPIKFVRPNISPVCHTTWGGGPRVVVNTAAFHVRGSVPGLGGLKVTKMSRLYPRVKVSIVGSLHD